MKEILLIEDHREISEVIGIHLCDAGFKVTKQYSGCDGLDCASKNPFDLIILDLMLPGMDGLEICKHLRSAQNFTPILMLTAKNSEIDRVVGLELGADDYLAKPFSIPELTARAKALIRRTSTYDQVAHPEQKLFSSR